MKKTPQYKCLIPNCGKTVDSSRGIKIHLRKIHNIQKPEVQKHYQDISKKAANPKQPWKGYAKYPDGSRQYRLIDGQWVKQQPGAYFKEKDKRKPKKKSEPATTIGTQFGEPMIDNGYILLPITLKIPFALGIPQIFHALNQEEG